MTFSYKEKSLLLAAFLLVLQAIPSCLAQSSKKQVVVTQVVGSGKVAVSNAGAAEFSRMSEFYEKLLNYSFSSKNTTSIKQGSSEEKHQTDYQFRFSKPLCLAVDVDRGAGVDKALARLSSTDFYVYLPPKGYVKESAPDDHDPNRLLNSLSAVVSRENILFGGLGMCSEVSPLKFFSNIKGFSTSSIKMVNVEKIGSESTKHLQLLDLPTVGLHYDMWIKEGADPWVVRTSVNVKNAEHKAEINSFTDFSDWQNNVKFADDTFKFTPPAGAKEIKVPDGTVASDMIGKPALEFTLNTTSGGKFDLASNKEKDIVILDFWATWCPPCRAALPVLADISQTYADKGVKFCAVNISEDPELVKKFLQAQNLKFTVGLDHDGTVSKAYQVVGIPRSVVIGKDGLVKFVHEGFSARYKQKLTEELDSLILESKQPK